MRLSFDQNLSHKLVKRLADIFPDSVHVRDIGMKSATDPAIANYALAHGFTIVSKDADFLALRASCSPESTSGWSGSGWATVRPIRSRPRFVREGNPLKHWSTIPRR